MNPTPTPPSRPAFLEACPEGTRLRLKVQPRASRNQIDGAAGNELRLRVTAPPVDAAANQAVVDFLAEILGCRRGDVRLLRGHASRHKVIVIAGLDPEAVRQRLER